VIVATIGACVGDTSNTSDGGIDASTIGKLGGACYGNGTCDSPLVCAGGLVCIEPADAGNDATVIDGDANDVSSDATDSSHHWRPWVNGLPVGTQPISWITGQWENGVYYYYAAAFGRTVWKREARGGDL